MLKEYDMDVRTRERFTMKLQQQTQALVKGTKTLETSSRTDLNGLKRKKKVV